MYEKPSPRVMWSWVALLLSVILPLTLVHTWLLDRFFPVLSLPYLILTLLASAYLFAIYLPRRRNNLRFALGERWVTVVSGVVVTTSRRMELSSVRQVTLLQGPIERRCHTAFLLISATGGYLLIEGVDHARAEEWCQRLYPL